jgi:hypothetical protein
VRREAREEGEERVSDACTRRGKPGPLLLLLNKLDVAQTLGGELDGLVEAVLTSVRHVDDLDDFRHQASIEHVGLVELGLEVGGSSEDNALAVDLVVGDEVRHGVLGDLAHVVVTLLHTETSETECGLSSTAVLFREVDGEFLEDLASVTSDGSEEGSVSVHDDETEASVGLEELGEGVGVELVVAEVEGPGEGREGSAPSLAKSVKRGYGDLRVDGL